MKASEELSKYWHHHVEAFAGSGLSRVAYCQKNQINTYQLDYWRRKFKGVEPTGGSDARNVWVPVEVREEEGAGPGDGIRLRIGRLTIEVKPGFDRELLTAVLRVVGPVC